MMKRDITPTPLTAEDQKFRLAFVAMREELNLTLPELAHELGMTPRAVRFYENGERVIPQHVRRMMDLLKRNHEMRKIVGTVEVV